MEVITKHKIILVDENESLIKDIKKHLESEGHNVKYYSDPVLLLKEFNSGYYELMFISVSIHNISGFEIAHNLQFIDPALKICFISGFKRYFESLGSEFPNVDSRKFLQKPVTKEELISKVKELFES